MAHPRYPDSLPLQRVEVSERPVWFGSWVGLIHPGDELRFLFGVIGSFEQPCLLNSPPPEYYAAQGIAADRFALYSTSVDHEPDEVPPPIRFEIRQGVDCQGVVRFRGLWTPSTPKQNWFDFLAQAANRLGDLWQVYASVPDATEPARVALRFYLDHCQPPHNLEWGDNVVKEFPAALSVL